MDRGQAQGQNFSAFLQMLFKALMDSEGAAGPMSVQHGGGGNGTMYEDTTSVGNDMGMTSINGGSIGSPTGGQENNPWGPNVTSWPDFDPYAGGTIGDAGSGTRLDSSPSTIGYTRPDLLWKKMNPRGPQPGLGMGMGNIMAQLQGLGGGGNLPAYSQPPGWASGATNPGRGMGQIAPQLGQMGSGGNQLGLLGQLARQVIGNVGAGAARGNAIRNIF